jgi:hypothetical protein
MLKESVREKEKVVEHEGRQNVEEKSSSKVHKCYSHKG